MELRAIRSAVGRIRSLTGFSLIEALIAAAVLSLAAAVLFGALLKSFVLSSQFGPINGANSVFSYVESELRRLEGEPGLPERYDLSGEREGNGLNFVYSVERVGGDTDRALVEALITVRMDAAGQRIWTRRVFLASV